ncbi:MAG: polyprenyl diphosphate synthase [Gemmatimonadota bacterium]
MIQSIAQGKGAPRHVAIIMDGNGRWAVRRGHPRPFGHRAGAGAVRRVVEAAPELGIETLSLYAFSADNWHRPAAEVTGLMRLFVRYLRTETLRCVDAGVCVSVIGRRDRLPDTVRAAIASCESATERGRALHLRLAIDYSSRVEMLAAAAAGPLPPGDGMEEFGRRIRGRAPGGREVPDVDLLIRTGGEQRLSDFMLWECAYAELCFMPVLWPDFGAEQLSAAVSTYRSRERRFGRVGAAAGRGAGS